LEKHKKKPCPVAPSGKAAAGRTAPLFLVGGRRPVGLLLVTLGSPGLFHGAVPDARAKEGNQQKEGGGQDSCFFHGQMYNIVWALRENFLPRGLVGIAGLRGLKLSPPASADNVKALSNNSMYDYTK
jgi:hypothetical protein